MRSGLSVRGMVTALALVAGPAQAGGPFGEPPARCTQAAIADVVLAAPVPIDEIRVVVAEGSPEAGAAEVMVEVSGGSDRVVHVRGGSRGLSFSPALTSQAFRVSLLPDLAAARDACVDRIELRRRGAPVATVVP
ncbi:MAG TPA: hypothetical protein VFU21_14670 [Kofleriaceae bacterium]|nr:hypothetical protein [Kofleriaceae bacterium]